MRTCRLVAVVLLLAGGLSASSTGVLIGKVVILATGEPYCGATVVALSTGARCSTDPDGRFELDALPESSTVVASAQGFFDDKKSVEIAAGCTTRTYFQLMEPLRTGPLGLAAGATDTLLVHRCLDDPKLRIDTVPGFLNPSDSKTRARSNSSKLALVGRRIEEGIKVAYSVVSAFPQSRHMWLVTGLRPLGPGMGYLREKVVVSYDIMGGAVERRSHGLNYRSPATVDSGRTYTYSELYRVTSIAVGYIRTTEFGEWNSSSAANPTRRTSGWC